MRDMIEGIPNALAMGASFTPGGAVARVGAAGVLGFAGGGIRDLIRKGMGEEPTDSIKSKLVTDALPAAAGQGFGEVVSLAGKALPTASSKGMSQAAQDLHLPAGPLSDAPLAQRYSEGKMREAVNIAGDEFRVVGSKIPASQVPRSEVAAQMAKTSKEGESFMRAALGKKFDAAEAPFRGQAVDASSSLDLARDLPDTFKGVKTAQRVLGEAEIPAGPGSARVVAPPFEDVRKLSKTPMTRSMRSRLEGDIESHISANAGPAEVAGYQKLKGDYKTQVGDLFDRGVVAKVFKDPQQVEAVFSVPGSSPGRLAAIKQAIDSHPDPKVAAEVWDTFKRSKYQQLLAEGPTKFSKSLASWDPKSLDIVFGAEAPSIIRLKELTDAMASNPKQAKALHDLIMSGKPPTFNLGGGVIKPLVKSGVRTALGGIGASVIGAPAAGGAIAGEAAGNLYGLAQNVISHNPNGGLSAFVNALDGVLKSGRTGGFWNALAMSARIGHAQRKRQRTTEEPPK
jgi:hypothetical protein